MYRNGSSVTRTLSDPSVTPLLPRLSGGQGLTIGGLGNSARSGLELEGSHLDRKLDQMMEMITNAQQMLVEQHSTQIILGEKVEQICSDVKGLQAEMKDMQQLNASAASSSEVKKQIKIPKQLSLAIKRLYNEVDEENKFDSKQSYSAEQNRKACDFLIQQLQTKFGDSFTLDVIKRAIYRYYESRRRLHNDSQPRRKEQVRANQKKQQRKCFQKRLYERRAKFTKNDEERRLLEQIDHQYMTEESESDGTVRRHELTWRSEALTKLLRKLDKRSQKGEKGAGLFSQKSRVSASPSTNHAPPVNAPEWACKAPGPSIDSETPTSISHSGSNEAGSTMTATPSGSALGGSGSSRRRIICGPELLENLELTSISEDSDLD